MIAEPGFTHWIFLPGFMQGLETTLPVGQVAAKALENGLVVISAGSNVIRMVPPLVIEKQHVDEMFEKLDMTLTEMEKNLH